jgi:hypothetical protein
VRIDWVRLGVTLGVTRTNTDQNHAGNVDVNALQAKRGGPDGEGGGSGGRDGEVFRPMDVRGAMGGGGASADVRTKPKAPMVITKEMVSEMMMTGQGINRADFQLITPGYGLVNPPTPDRIASADCFQLGAELAFFPSAVWVQAIGS